MQLKVYKYGTPIQLIHSGIKAVIVGVFIQNHHITYTIAGNFNGEHRRIDVAEVEFRIIGKEDYTQIGYKNG